MSGTLTQTPLPTDSATRLVEKLLAEAIAREASDIHIDPEYDRLRIRMRVDGALKETASLPKLRSIECIARLKILAGLRTDEHFKAQDGRFRFLIHNDTWIDVRISITPTYYGENAVLRLLAPHSAEQSLRELGMSERDESLVLHTLSLSSGMVLVTGPTGSGKTTTLYTMMRMLAEGNSSLVTIEDPIEYSMPGIRQIQTNASSGLTFAEGLRSMLRQDPDIIMVGEIRDKETAQLAVNASLTGHLVLSTLHTNDAPTTLPRLLDMGIEPYLIASTVRLVISQRLVRRICQECMEEKPTGNSKKAWLASGGSESQLFPKTLYHGVGCSACDGSGYRGRVGLYEVLPVESSLQEAITERVGVSTLRGLAASLGMASIRADGLLKVAAGQTTIEEILRTRYE